MSTYTVLFTQLWLISQGRIADLVEYTRLQNPEFTRETNIVISDITHTSFNFDIKFDLLNPRKWAEAVKMIHDIKAFEEEETNRRKAEIDSLQQEIIRKSRELDEATADRDQDRIIKLQQHQMEMAERQYKLAKEAAEFRLGFIDRAADTAKKFVDLFYPNADPEKKAIAAHCYLSQLLQVSALKEVDILFLLPSPSDEQEPPQTC
jgi:hypothetical protein